MSGYKRVSFYELCRLCASTTQKEKTHIFQEEGRKIQLQSKIQSCLALTVNENDFLPKVICGKCLRCLETCFVFRQECVRSETMLSAYFKNFRHTEDFKQSGKVYIKDIKPTPPPPVQSPHSQEISAGIAAVVQTITAANAKAQQQQQPVEPQVPYYTLQLPTIVTNPNPSVRSKKNDVMDNNKMNAQLTQNQFAYNLNLINTSAMKSNLLKADTLSNVVVNANGEVINISQMGELEAILNQSLGSKKHRSGKRTRVENRVENQAQNENLVKIDLTAEHISTVYNIEQPNVKYDKLPHIKSTHSQPSKYNHVAKIDEKAQNPTPTVIFPLPEYNQNFNNFSNPTTTYTQPNVTNPIPSNPNLITATNVEGSPVSINVLNQTLQEINQNGFTNVISNVITSNPEPEKVNVPADSSNVSTTTPTKMHVCDICSRGFKRREHLYQHVKLHTGFRPYICESCNKAFMRKEHLLRHSTLHSGQKNFTCNICEKSFSRNDNLLKHKKTHEKQSSFTCEICQKQFVMKHYYDAHKMTHGDKFFENSVWGLLKT